MSTPAGIEDLPPSHKGRAAAETLDAVSVEGAVFDAVLRPNRSLPNSGFIAVMAAVCIVNFFAGLVFFLQGAWPVIGFCGLDILLVWGAFKLSYRQGRLRERVVVTPEALTVQRILPSGHETRWSLQPYWTRLALERAGEHDARVRLVSHGRSLFLGAFLAPEEREEFGRALKTALDAARTGVAAAP